MPSQESQIEKDAPPPLWKNWDGYKVNTISAKHVEHVEFEQFLESEDIVGLRSAISKIKDELELSQDATESIELQTKLEKLQQELKDNKSAQYFKLSPQSSTCVVKVKMDDFATKEEELKHGKMLQLPVNMNDAATGHKLQGMSKDKLIVPAWTMIPN